MKVWLDWTGLLKCVCVCQVVPCCGLALSCQLVWFEVCLVVGDAGTFKASCGCALCVGWSAVVPSLVLNKPYWAVPAQYCTSAGSGSQELS